jgi:hypothetical protein
MTNKTQSEQNKSAFVLPTKQTLAIARAHPTRVNGSALVLKAAWTLAHLQSFLKHLSEETAYSAGDSAGAARRDSSRMDSQRHATNLQRSAGREGMAFLSVGVLAAHVHSRTQPYRHDTLRREITSGADLTLATHPAAGSRSECQIRSTRNLYLLVVL